MLRPTSPVADLNAWRVLCAAVLSRPLALAITLMVSLFSAIAPVLVPRALAGDMSVLATDGYFDVSRIDASTYAIREPHYWQLNISYVLKGEDRAILFDTGSGTRDISFMAGSVTRKPMTVIASHLHYDHIGSHGKFKQVAMIDVPEVRAATTKDWYPSPVSRSLAPFTPGFQVTEWWKPGTIVDLGGRLIEVVSIPGHTGDSIALIDRANGYAFVGDHLYGGPLLANLPGSDLTKYIESTRRLLREFPEIRTVFGAHGEGRTTRQSLEELESSLVAIQERRAQGESLWWLGWTASRYPGGDGFTIIAP